MKRFAKRLKVLETAVHAKSWSDGLAEVRKLAQRRLSMDDQVLLEETNGLFYRGEQKRLSGAHHNVWKRWDAALALATEDLRFPVLLSANEWLA